MANADFDWQRKCVTTHTFLGGYIVMYPDDDSIRILVFSHYVSLTEPFREFPQYIARWNFNHYEFDVVSCDTTSQRITPIPTAKK